MTGFKLEEEYIRNTIEAAMFAAENEFVAKKAITVIGGDKGITDVRYKTGVDTNEPTLLQSPYSSHAHPSDVSFTYSNFRIWADLRKFEMSDWEMAADRDSNYKDTLLTRTMLSMARLQDKIIMDGWYDAGGTAVSGTSGFLASAVNTHAAASTWITLGDPFTDVLVGLEKFGEKKLPVNKADLSKVYLFCSPARRVSLSQLDSNGISHLTHISKDLGIPEENILASDNITATVALLVYKDPMYAQMVEPESMMAFPPWQMDQTNWQWKIRNVFGFKIMNTDSIYKITGV
jgi:hypothetical protein